jgi:hypothetical protein
MRLDGVLRDGICDLRFAMRRLATSRNGIVGKTFFASKAHNHASAELCPWVCENAAPQVDGLCGFFERSMYANSACER